LVALRSPYLAVPHLPRGVRGLFDIDTRQRVRVIWPLLARVPDDSGTRVLDAGCGPGEWSLEMAAAKRCWDVVGIDCQPAAIDTAVRAAAIRGLDNVTFECADFLTYRPRAPFDLVLSVGSAHYLAERGEGTALFRQFANWLRPDGLLILYGPRRGPEVPRVSSLPEPFVLRDVFSAEELRGLCRDAGLAVERLVPATGPAGTLAKQIRRLVGSSHAGRALAMPVQYVLDVVDRLETGEDLSTHSAALLLTARRMRSTSC
jgi:SAM-dependent methyltransferase